MIELPLLSKCIGILVASSVMAYGGGVTEEDGALGDLVMHTDDIVVGRMLDAPCGSRIKAQDFLNAAPDVEQIGHICMGKTPNNARQLLVRTLLCFWGCGQAKHHIVESDEEASNPASTRPTGDQRKYRLCRAREN